MSSSSIEFYKRFHKQLSDSSDWPSSYLFKFIIPNDPERIDVLFSLFEDLETTVRTKISSKKTYTSISITTVVDSPDVVINKYKQAAKIKDIIQL